ncbi:hypothetical protein ACET3Z_013914 [Daucus carota]
MIMDTPFSIFCFLCLLSVVCCVDFKISRFDPDDTRILYQGDAVPSVGAIELINRRTYQSRVGRVMYAELVPIWDSDSGKLSDFTTHFTFTIDTQSLPSYGHGLAFFLAPVGFQIPPNSAGGFLGLFNTSNSDSPANQIVAVEFDSFPNPEWDPSYEHVGININSVSSSVNTSWNASLHSGDTADVWIVYDASVTTLSVFWAYQEDPRFQKNSSLSYKVDLGQVLPEMISIGFSSATGQNGERATIKSWEFNSTLTMEHISSDTKKASNIMLDSNFNLKLGDFGLARLMDHELGPQTTGLAGTFGYLAPEYVRTGRASKESDVYSFGVVILEIVTGRRSVNVLQDGKSEMGLVEWIWNLYGSGELLLAVDGRLNKEFDASQVECLMIVGLWCAHPDQNFRPSIRQAIQVLNFEAAMPTLPSKMPVPIYAITPLDKPEVSSSDASMTYTSINLGR